MKYDNLGIREILSSGCNVILNHASFNSGKFIKDCVCDHIFKLMLR